MLGPDLPGPSWRWDIRLQGCGDGQDGTKRCFLTSLAVDDAGEMVVYVNRNDILCLCFEGALPKWYHRALKTLWSEMAALGEHGLLKGAKQGGTYVSVDVATAIIARLATRGSEGSSAAYSTRGHRGVLARLGVIKKISDRTLAAADSQAMEAEAAMTDALTRAAAARDEFVAARQRLVVTR